MPNMSFIHTADKIRKRQKWVTRRVGAWENLKAGTVVNACERCRGLKLGERVNVLAKIVVVSVRIERLSNMTADPSYGRQEARLEGYPEMTGREFVEMFCEKFGVDPTDRVTRIEFKYLD